ncbi:MAG: HNH endonuclease [Bryobacteraceae bacterium]|jgi:hypothetical protein
MAGRQALIAEVLKSMKTDFENVKPDGYEEVVCPLCLRPFTLERGSQRRPSAEHIRPSSLGGTLEFPVVTCTDCNNAHGRQLEAHLTKAMHAFDFLDGKGVMPVKIENEFGHVSANLDWNATPITFKVVGEKASDTRAVEALPGVFRQDAKIRFTVKFGFAPEPYWRAVLRIGYLAAFFQFGYRYVFSAGAAQVREILDGAAVPENLIMKARPDLEPPLPLLVHALGDSILVLFRTDSLITRWTAVVLPGPNGSLWTDLAKAEMNARHLLMNFKFDKTGASINFRFAREPIKEMRNLRVPDADTSGD